MTQAAKSTASSTQMPRGAPGRTVLANTVSNCLGKLIQRTTVDRARRCHDAGAASPELIAELSRLRQSSS